ncbi:four helix bundle protein [Algoriphagus formosus]|uniref:four helix bundle protein n=1 Tax=Algoriphagus formosus TaxID=2007308 RepID=UPI000C28F284|nr:four helix bundle protein [Algoriphagus formosus]
MKVQRFEDLEIWKEAREIALTIKELTRKSEFSKDYKFVAQITSASGSTMDNIAEGFDRDGNKEFFQFLSIAKGSNSETRSQAYRAYDFKYIDEEELNKILLLTEKLKAKINSLMIYLKNSDRKGNKYS